MVNLFCAIKVSVSRFPRFIRTAESSRTLAGSPASLHSLNRLIPAHFGPQSDRIRTPFRTQSDGIPKQLGHHSDGAPKTVRVPPEHCPDSVGTVSGLHRNSVRLHVGTLSDLRRNTHLAVSELISGLLQRIESS